MAEEEKNAPKNNTENTVETPVPMGTDPENANPIDPVQGEVATQHTPVEQGGVDAEEGSPNEEGAGTKKARIDALKRKADLIGVNYSPNIGEDTLRERIRAKQEEIESAEKTARLNPKGNSDFSDTPGIIPSKADRAARASQLQKESMNEMRTRIRKEKMKLVRVRIANLNPSKRDLQGEIVTVSNKFIGTVRKFVPFGDATDNGYHIPKVLYDELISRKFQDIRTKTVNGQIKVDTRLVSEYSIQVLPPLTKAELKDLADKQAAAERLGA